MYNRNEYTRFLLDEERRLMREIESQRMSWNKVGKLIKLSALLSSHGRSPY